MLPDLCQPGKTRQAVVFKDDRKRTFLNAEGADKPLKSPVPHETVVRARGYRLSRIRRLLAEHDCAAILLYNPVNIRSAFDCVNMQVWTLHNPLRYALIFAEGPGIMFEFKGSGHVCEGLETIDELRVAIGWMYMTSGDRVPGQVSRWAGEIADLVREHGGGNRRIAIDRLDLEGLRALQEHGIAIIDGAPLIEHARAIKSADEIELMRWTIRVCEAGMARIYEHSVPGVTEQELWSHLHFENARSGGEWLETRLLTCGPNTNPWYRECGERACRNGEMISFDTDMIGPYGYCADLSRSWTCGYTAMTSKQCELYRAAIDQIGHNLSLIRDGVSFSEFNDKSWRVPVRFQAHRYSMAVHGVGMADEWPVVLLHTDFEHSHGGRFEKNMVVCVESLIAESGTESIKLETQVLVTETGAERLDSFPWEDIG
jgi:Xaa-Pro aminopeptidase